jgi:hypothetical protein
LFFRQLLFDGVILSADDFFTSDNGDYLYEHDKVGDAHDWNHERALINIRKGTSPIIIDNTNSRTWEMKPYVVRVRKLMLDNKMICPMVTFISKGRTLKTPKRSIQNRPNHLTLPDTKKNKNSDDNSVERSPGLPYDEATKIY